MLRWRADAARRTLGSNLCLRTAMSFDLIGTTAALRALRTSLFHHPLNPSCYHSEVVFPAQASLPSYIAALQHRSC